MVEGIYVTLGADQIKERGFQKILVNGESNATPTKEGMIVSGYRDHIRDFKKCDGENGIYWWRLGNKPKHEFATVYIVIGNKVRWKARFLDWGGEGWMQFDDGREIFAKQWMMLIDFEPMPRPYEIRKGFQGFRYKYD